MAKAAKARRVSAAEIEAAISRIKARSPLGPLSEHTSRSAALRPLHRSLRKELLPLLRAGGLNNPKIDKALKRHQREAKALLGKQSKTSGKIASKQRQEYRFTLENRQNALDRLAGLPHLATPILIDQPYSIYTIPSGMEVDSNIVPHASYVKIRHADAKDTVLTKSVSTRFFFAWQNEPDYAAVIKADADLVCQGFCEASSSIGFLSGGKASLSLGALMNVYLAGNKISGSGSAITSVSAESSWFFGAGDIDLQFVTGTTNVSSPVILVREGQLVIFDVVLYASYDIDNGSILIDFSSHQDSLVMCPHLVVGLLTPPPFMASPGPGIGSFG